MRIQLIALFLLLSGSAFATNKKETQEVKEMRVLFDNYFQVMEHHKTELIEDVFSKKFLADNGGKEKFAKEVKELPKSSSKSLASPRISVSKGAMNDFYFTKVVKPSAVTKAKPEAGDTAEFIVIKEDGKFKVQGTISDGD